MAGYFVFSERRLFSLFLSPSSETWSSLRPKKKRACSQSSFLRLVSSKVAQARNMNTGNICVGKKPIVSVTYENERTSIKNSSPYIKCVLRLSFVVHGPIYGRFMGCTGHKSARKPHRKEETHNLSKVSRFLFKSFYIRRLQKQMFFSDTNPYILNVTQQCRWSYFELGHLWFLPTTVCVSNRNIRHKIGENTNTFVLFCSPSLRHRNQITSAF